MDNQQESLMNELKVSAPLINEQLESHAARFAYYGGLASEASRNARNAKTAAEVIEAQIIRDARANWPEGEGRRSEWVVMSIVRADPRWQQAWNIYHQQKHQADMMQVAKEAFAQRKDLLVTMAANLRGEMSGHARINTQQSKFDSQTREWDERTIQSTKKKEEDEVITHIEQTLSQSSKSGSNLHKLQDTFRQQQREK